MRIAFVSFIWYPDVPGEAERMPGGPGWWRCRVPAGHLRANGYDAVHVPALASLPSGEIVPVSNDGVQDTSGYDVVVIQRWMHEEAVGVIRRARACGQVVVNDCDDWLDGLDTSNAFFRALHPRNSPHLNCNHYRAALAASTALTVTTPYLAERLRHLGRPVQVIRNAIDLERWAVRESGNDVPVVGWVGATPYRSGDLETLRGVLGPYLRRHGFRFAHHGDLPEGPRAADLLGLEPDLVERVEPTRRIDVYPEMFHGLDIGLVPLRVCPFNLAKSAAKGMEYAAAGIPFAAQSTPEYDWFDRRATAKRPKDWIARLEHLASPEARRDEARRLRERVVQLDAALRWRDWESFYLDLAD